MKGMTPLEEEMSMSMKFRLFASVAAPLVSLPLLIQPAGALPLPAVETVPMSAPMSGVIQVQDKPPLLPPGAQAQEKGGDDKEQKPRRPPQGAQEQGGAQGGGERPQRRQQADQNQGGGGNDRQRPPAQQDAGQAQGQGPGERPQRRQQADQNQGGSDRQRPPVQQNADPGRGNAPAAGENRRQQADQNQGGSDRQRPPAQQNAEPAKPATPPVKPPTQQSADPGKGTQPPAAGDNRRQQADQNQGTPAGKPPAQQSADPTKPATPPVKPPTQQSADPGKGTQPPAAGGNRPQQADQNQGTPAGKPPTQQNADPTKPGQPPAAGGNRPQQADQNQNGNDPRRPPAQQNADPTKPGQPPAAGGNRPQQADQNQNGNDPRQRPQQNADQPQRNNDRQPLPGQPGQQNADQNQRGNDRTTVNPGATREQADTRPQPRPETPRTPEQVERAKQIAKDPRAARDNEKVVLPVENGAAVLDSAKEDDRPRRDGDRPRRPPPQQADQRDFTPPRSDADAQAGRDVSRQQRDQWRQMRRELADERGQRLDARPQYDRPQGWDYRDVPPGMDRDRDRDGRRVIISIDNETYVRNDDSRRFYDENRGARPQYERLRDGQVREVITRDDGTRVVTVRNRYGEIVQRSRIVRGGNEYVLYYAPELMDQQRGQDYVWRDPGDDLPPMRLNVPVDDYIIDTSSQPNRDYYQFLEKPPVERVERVYTLDEVRYSARIRDKVPRIDLDTVTFATGSAEIPMNQASSLRQVADAINKVLKNDPSETFLIEGHTDAVGSDESNLVLSDERAESVARVLTDAFAIPPENLSTQGYGERYLKVRTDGPSQENRRVTIRRITSLVKPIASNQ